MSNLPPTQTAKVSVIGCGRVGMTSAFTMFAKDTTHELVLHGRCKDSIVGEQLDLEHAVSFTGNTKVTATDNYKDIANSDVVVITAGASQKPGDTRLDLAAKNISIIDSIIPQVVRYAPDAIILIVSNPVDVLTYRAYQISGLPKGRIFGSGTTLDTSRFRFHLSEIFKVNPRSIHAYILGEHGDSSFAAVSQATIGGQLLTTFPQYSAERVQKAFEISRDAAYKIIASKGSTYYAIGVVVDKIVKTILSNKRSVLPVSIPLHGQYGLHGVSLSVPCIVGRNGVEEILETKLSWDERKKLEKSAEIIKSFISGK
jgi:L-lactate dehydrogenase